MRVDVNCPVDKGSVLPHRSKPRTSFVILDRIPIVPTLSTIVPLATSAMTQAEVAGHSSMIRSHRSKVHRAVDKGTNAIATKIVTERNKVQTMSRADTRRLGPLISLPSNALARGRRHKHAKLHQCLAKHQTIVVLPLCRKATDRVALVRPNLAIGVKHPHEPSIGAVSSSNFPHETSPPLTILACGVPSRVPGITWSVANHQIKRVVTPSSSHPKHPLGRKHHLEVSRLEKLFGARAAAIPRDRGVDPELAPEAPVRIRGTDQAYVLGTHTQSRRSHSTLLDANELEAK